MTKLIPKDTPNKRRKIGGKNSRDDIDWDLAESFYIQGEIIQQRNKQGDLVRKKPSYSDVGRKFKASAALVHYHAKKRGWQDKRKTWERMAAQHVEEAVSKARALSFAEGAGILDSWLIKFQEALEQDKVRTDSLSDFNTALRLKAFIDQQGSAAADKPASGVTLEELQRRHKVMRDASAAMTAELTGVLEDETPGEGGD